MSSSDPAETADTARDSYLLVPIGELTRRVGTRRLFPVRTHLHVPSVAGVAVPDHEPVTGNLMIESVLDGIVVAGTLVAPWSGECRRCLDPIRGTVDIAVRELFEANPTPGDTYPIDGDHIDLQPLVHDAVLLALPLSPICRADCAGPDPERFPTIVEDDTGVIGPPVGDPRWSTLSELRFDD